MIIDTHTHVFPDKIARKAVETVVGRCESKDRLQPTHWGTVQEFLALQQADGVDVSVTLSVAAKPQNTPHVNDFAISLLKVPGLIPFGSVHPDFPHWEAELERLRAAGIQGIKLHPDEQLFYVEEARMVPIYKKIFSLGFALVFHAGLDASLGYPVHCTPQGVAKQMDLFEGQPVIFAHMGGFNLWQDVKTCMLGHAIYIDTSFSVDQMPEGLALEMIRQHGADRVLFGSDSPWGSASVVRNRLEKMPLTAEERRKILGENAFRLFLDKTAT